MQRLLAPTKRDPTYAVRIPETYQPQQSSGAIDSAEKLQAGGSQGNVVVLAGSLDQPR